MVNREIEQVISRFIKTLSAKGVHIEKVILYGSFASGKSHEGSDIDIAVISPDFGKDRFEEGKSLHQIAWRVDPRIEPVPISSKAYNTDTWLPLIHELHAKGIEIPLG